jgi:RHS repeat-associated protein
MASGPKAGANRYRFSSKPIHELSGMYDYLYRWYVPELHRWGNRDPIRLAELLPEGPNLHAFVQNSPVSLLDVDGRAADVVVVGGGGVAVIGLACLLSPQCRDALGNLLRELAKACERRIDPAPGKPERIRVRCSLLKAGVNSCIYECVYKRRATIKAVPKNPDGTCDGSKWLEIFTF